MTIRFTEVVKSFSGRVAVRGVTLEIAPGQVHALVGHNGSGKSTLIKMLSGYHKPDSGTISVDGDEIDFRHRSAHARRRGVHFVHQDLGLIDSLTVSENLHLEPELLRESRLRLRRSREIAQSIDLLSAAGSDIQPKTRIHDLRPYQRTTVAIARALQGQARYLVLDEPTAAMTRPEVERLFSSIRETVGSGVGVLYVSHHIDEIFEIADSVSVLRDGSLINTYARSALPRDKLISLIAGAPSATIVDREHREKDRVDVALDAESISGAGFRSVSFAAAGGEILGFAGVDGSGREGVLQAVFGAERRVGTIRLGTRTLRPNRPDLSVKEGLVFVPADRRRFGLLSGMSLLDNVCTRPRRRSALSRLRRSEEAAEVREWTERLRMVVPSRHVPVDTLSGGTQQKVVLARALRLNPLVLLVDEPTQGVDVGSGREIHQLIRQIASSGAAVLIASSDDEELATLCDRVLVMRAGAVTKELHAPSAHEITRAVLGGISG